MRAPDSSSRIPRIILAIPLLLGLIGCTKKNPSPGDQRSSHGTGVKPGTLRFELPAGVKVRVDGKEPVEPADMVLSPGPHKVQLVGPCESLGNVETSVDLSPGATKTVTATGLLKMATLSLTVNTPEGPPEGLEVKIGDALVDGTKPIEVVACVQRLQIHAKGWGGFMEDIEFEAGAQVRREVMLAKGPDLVRIQGVDEFTLGPPKAWGEKYSDYSEYGWKKRRKVTIKTFDLDRTEVTAAQYHECRRAGGCKMDKMLWLITHYPPRGDGKMCTIDLREDMRPPVAGRANFPVNCVARWEAEQYCAWAGKRLPKSSEWEFAARSRNETYNCPWPTPPRSMCRFQPPPPLGDVCANEGTQSQQGICDLMTGVKEYVEGPPGEATRGANFQGIFMDASFDSLAQRRTGGYLDPWRGSEQGFRCARDVPRNEGI